MARDCVAMPVSDPVPPACAHERIQVVARQQGAEFFECLDCHTILDGDDLSTAPEEAETIPEIDGESI